MLMMYAEISVKIRTYSQILFIAFEVFSFSKFVLDHIVFDYELFVILSVQSTRRMS